MTTTITDAIAHARSSRERNLADLKELVRIPSVSFSGFDPKTLERSAAAVATLLRKRGLENVSVLRVPGAHPYVYGDWLHAPGAPTLLLYAHHDVQPPGRAELWKSPPFEPTVRAGRIYGRGTADDKAAIVLWTGAVDSLLKTAGRLPLNVKILVEGEEEIGSENLPRFLKKHRRKLAADAIVIADTGNTDTGIPAVTTSLRGLVCMDVVVRSARKPVHSGVWGGPLPDPVQALAKMIASLTDASGRMTIPGVYRRVRKPSPAEQRSLVSLAYGERKLREQSGLLPKSRLIGNGSPILSKIWYEPALSVNAIQASSRKDCSNIINETAWCRLGIRIVSDMVPKETAALLKRHLLAHAPWGVEVSFEGETSAPAWRVDPDSPVFQDAAKALELGYGRKPAFAGCGGSIGFVEPFTRALGGIPALLMGLGDPYANHHGENESMHLGDMFKATDSTIHMMRELSRPGLWARAKKRTL